MPRKPLPTDLKHIMSQNIKRLLTENSLTQVDFAHMVGVEESVVSKIVNGKSGMALETVKKAAEVFDVSTDEILYPQGESR